MKVCTAVEDGQEEEDRTRTVCTAARNQQSRMWEGASNAVEGAGAYRRTVCTACSRTHDIRLARTVVAYGRVVEEDKGAYDRTVRTACSCTNNIGSEEARTVMARTKASNTIRGKRHPTVRHPSGGAVWVGRRSTPSVRAVRQVIANSTKTRKVIGAQNGWHRTAHNGIGRVVREHKMVKIRVGNLSKGKIIDSR